MSSEKIRRTNRAIVSAALLFLNMTNSVAASDLVSAGTENISVKAVEKFKNSEEKMARLRKYISPIINTILNRSSDKPYNNFMDMQITFPLAHPYSPKLGEMDYTIVYPSKPPYDGSPKIKPHFSFCFSNKGKEGKQCVSTELQQDTIAQAWKALSYYINEVCVKTNKHIVSNREKEIDIAKKDLDKLIKMGDDWKEALKDPEVMRSTYYYQLKTFYNPSPIPLSALVININKKNKKNWTGDVTLSCWNKKPVPIHIIGDGTFGQMYVAKPGWDAFKLHFYISSN